MSMVEALRLIAAVSKKYASDATKAIRSDNESSRQIMFNTIAQSVLADEEIELSAEERRLISSFITEDNEGGRDYTMRVRLNARERFLIEDLASESKMTVSDFVRKIFLAIGDTEDPKFTAYLIIDENRLDTMRMRE